jgi:hypothetical protein
VTPPDAPPKQDTGNTGNTAVIPAVAPVKGEKKLTDAQLLQNGIMIQSTIMVLNKIIYGISKNEALKFDDDETQQLVEAWSPFMPEVSPLTGAIVTTVIIIAGKISVAVIDGQKNKKKEVSKDGKPLKSSFSPESLEEKQDALPSVQ